MQPIPIDENEKLFNRCRAPISSIRAQRLGNHCHVAIWINGGKSGDLVVRAGREFDELMAMLLA
jgi:hypothetical protein